MNTHTAAQQETDIYKKRCEAKDIDVKRTYEKGFLITSVFPVSSPEEKTNQSIEITEGLIALIQKSKK